ncbi:MAG TPA: OmpA family protein [Burkholderiales bacterium]
MRQFAALADEEEHSEGAGANRWMVSYADFITLLFVLFLALYARLPKLTEDGAAQPVGQQAQTAQDKRPASRHVENGHVASTRAEGGQEKVATTLAQAAGGAPAAASTTPASTNAAATPGTAAPATPAPPAPASAAPIAAVIPQPPAAPMQPAPAAPPAAAQANAAPTLITPPRPMRAPNYPPNPSGPPSLPSAPAEPMPAQTTQVAQAAPAAAPASAPAPAAAPAPASAPPSLTARLHQSVGGLPGGNVALSSRSNAVVLDIADTSLFASGTAQLTPQAQEVLARIAAAIGGGRNQVIVEGHTDNLPIKSVQFPSNWELSSARAAAVARALQERGVDPARLTASGLANTRPRASNDTEEGRRANRRVSVIVLNN